MYPLHHFKNKNNLRIHRSRFPGDIGGAEPLVPVDLDLVQLLVRVGAAVAPRSVDPVLVRYQVPELQSREGISAAERRGDKSGKGM